MEAQTLSDEPRLLRLRGRVDVIAVPAMMRQWAWKDQVEAAKKLVIFSKPGLMVIGYQLANVEGLQAVNPALQVPQGRHDPVWLRCGTGRGRDRGVVEQLGRYGKGSQISGVDEAGSQSHRFCGY